MSSKHEINRDKFDKRCLRFFHQKTLNHCLDDSWIGKIPWRRKWQPTPVFCLENTVDKGAWRATAHWVARVEHDLVTEQQQEKLNKRSHISCSWIRRLSVVKSSPQISRWIQHDSSPWTHSPWRILKAFAGKWHGEGLGTGCTGFC